MPEPVVQGPVNAALIATVSPASQLPPAQFAIDADVSAHGIVVVVVVVVVVTIL